WAALAEPVARIGLLFLTIPNLLSTHHRARGVFPVGSRRQAIGRQQDVDGSPHFLIGFGRVRIEVFELFYFFVAHQRIVLAGVVGSGIETVSILLVGIETDDSFLYQDPLVHAVGPPDAVFGSLGPAYPYHGIIL